MKYFIKNNRKYKNWKVYQNKNEGILLKKCSLGNESQLFSNNFVLKSIR